MFQKQQSCAEKHHAEQKVCPRCGAVYPLQVGSFIGPYEVVAHLEDHHHFHTYQLDYEGDDFLLQEYRDHLLPAYRETLDAHLDHVDSEVFVHPEQRFVEVYGDLSLSYTLYTYSVGSLSVDEAIRKYGYLGTDVVFRVISELLESLSQYDEAGLVHNHLNSFSLKLTPDGLRSYQQFYTDRWGEKHLLSPHVSLGFSPPEQIRTGVVFRETDRYALAMVLFHLLTGLTPTLWYPDVPSLKRFRYFLSPELVRFYENLLEPADRFSWSDLKAQWQNLQQKLPNTQRFAPEVKAFYQGVAYYDQGQTELAFSAFDALYQHSDLHNPHVLRYLGRLCWESGRQRDGSLFYGEACRRESLGVFYQELAHFFYTDSAVDRAMLCLKKAVRRTPYVPQIYTFIAQILFDQARYKEAEIWLVEALRLKPSAEPTRLLHKIRAKISPSNQVHTTTDAAAFSFKRTEMLPWKEAAKFVDFVNTEPLSPQDMLNERYTVKTFIDRSAKGVVSYQVEDAEGHLYWVKGFPLNFRGRYRWEREVHTIQQLDHDHIPRFVESFEAANFGYLVYTHVEGSSLADLIEQGILFDYADIQKIFEDIFAAVSYMNENYLIHADVKPENILWNETQKKAFLVDFDVSVDLKNEGTQRKSVGVSVEYAPPEQKRLRLVDFTTDIYALCTTLMYLATGLEPNHFYYHDQKAFADFDTLIPFTRGFQHLLSGVLADRPEDRLEACQSLIHQMASRQCHLFLKAPKPEYAVLREAILALKQADSESLPVLAQALLQKQRSHITLFVVGDRFARIEKHGEAQKYFEEAMLRNPRWLYPYYGLARIWIKSQAYKPALKLLEKAIEKAPHATYTYNLMAEIYQMQNDFASAILCFDKALATDTKNLEVLVRLAKLHAALNHFELARGYCEQALAIHVLEDRAYQVLQGIFAIYGQLDKALEYGLRAVSIKPRKAEYHYDYGISLYRLQQHEAAVKAFRQSLVLKPELTDAHYFLGNCYLSLNQPEEALVHLNKVLALGKEKELVSGLITIAEKQMQLSGSGTGH